jgi:pimeloyl-ACP methyl ester carboxylesterase
MGCDIHYLRWGPKTSALPGVLFLHAGGAHAQWWSFIAPFIAEDRPVAAIDFSGMGDSGRRDGYDSSCHVAEITAVLAAAALGPKPIIVGHSFGGYIAMCHGARHGKGLGGIIFADTALRPEAEAKAAPVEAYTRPIRIYPDRTEILARFRLGPAQPCENRFILDYLAGTSIAPRDGGWAWKFDVAARGNSHHEEPLADYVSDLPCRKALIYGADSAMMMADAAAFTTGLFGPGDPVVQLPAAHHHLFLDQPIAFVAALRAILSSWV